MNRILFNMLTLTCLWAGQCFAQTWLPVGPGIGCNNAERVHDITITADSSKLLIAGLIIQNGLCDTMRAALSYDGIQLQEIAEPMIGAESTISFEYSGHIYASGYFVPQSSGGYPLAFNIKSDGNIWDTVPNGCRGSTHDYLIHDEIVYLSGWLEYCGDVPCSLVCSFDGTQVLPYYTGTATSGFGYAIEVYQDTIFVSGNFSSTDGSQYEGYNKCCKIVNGQLEKVAQGFPLGGTFLDMEEYDGKLFIAGASYAHGITGSHRIYYYENGQLHTLPTEPDYKVTAIKAYNGGLYVAGDFDNIGNMPCHRIARWDGQTWTCLSDNMFYYQNGLPCTQDCIRDIEIWNDTLYIGGRFHRIGDTELRRIAKLDMALSEAFPVSITEQARQELKLSVYPNPANNQINIQLDRPCVVSIYTTTGQLLETLTSKSNYQVDVSNYPAGLYVARCGDEVVRFVRE